MVGVRWLAATTAIAVTALSVLFGLGQAANAASPTTTTLVVIKGGNRIGPQSVAGLSGATFDFFSGTAGLPPASGATPTASCTTNASGSCSVDVPGLVGGSDVSLVGYWIKERTAPSGWSVISTLDTGSGDATTPTMYNQLFTGNVANNNTYTFPSAQTGNDIFTARGPDWAGVRNNPALPGQCGLNIAMVLDTSGAVAPFLSQLEGAANGFVSALSSTPSQVAIYGFAMTASQLAPSTSVATSASAAPLTTAIDGLTAIGGTNWDQGLGLVASSSTKYDLVLMITGGNPTVYGPDAEGPGGNTRFREVENAIFSANALKAKGTRVIVVGVGAGVAGAAENMKAISGPTRNQDFVQATINQLGRTLRMLAQKTCTGTKK
jgi:hypothetical protein